jgi:hypothetical protein
MGGALEAQAQAKPVSKPKSSARKPALVRALRPAKATSKPRLAAKAAVPVLLRPAKPAASPAAIAKPSIGLTVPGVAPIATRPTAAASIASPVTAPLKAVPVALTDQGDRKVPVLGDLPILGRLFTISAVQATRQNSLPVTASTTKAQGFGGQGTARGGLSTAGGFGVNGQTTSQFKGGFAGQGTGGSVTGGFAGQGTGSRGFSGKPATAGQFGGGGFGGNGKGQFRSQGGAGLFGTTQSSGFGGGGGLTRAVEAEPDFTIDFDRNKNEVSVDLTNTPLSVALRTLARKSKTSVVIEPGDYGDVTMVLNDIPLEAALRILCRAAGATYRNEENVFYIMPKGR